MESLEASILHVDMDAFFAAVELRRRPDLTGQPVIIGGSGRGVVLTATYEARRFGVHSGMAMVTAIRQCPQAVVLPPDQALYHEASRAVMALFRTITPLVEQVSVDEAFLDVAGARRRLGSASQIGQLIRARVRSEQQLACSVGVAGTKSVAKIASQMAKPDGLLEVPPAQTVEFLHSLPVGRLWGVGGKTGQVLARWGITTVAQLANTPAVTLRRALGPAQAKHLLDLAWGRDPRPVSPTREEKSLGAETTFQTDLPPGPVLEQELYRLTDKAAWRLRQSGLMCRTVGIKVRTQDFVTQSRSRSLTAPDDATSTLFEVARELLAGVDLGGRLVRLIGLRLENLSELASAGQQLGLDEVETSQRAAQLVSDQVRARFGPQAVQAARLIRTD